MYNFQFKKNNKVYREMVEQKKICNFEKYYHYYAFDFRSRIHDNLFIGRKRWTIVFPFFHSKSVNIGISRTHKRFEFCEKTKSSTISERCYFHNFTSDFSIHPIRYENNTFSGIGIDSSGAALRMTSGFPSY